MDKKIKRSAESYMLEAVRLAESTACRVTPNPRTGAVVVRDQEIIGRGRHECFGGPHAEVNAIYDAGFDVKDCDMFVTLEPCCHTGKTPPCTDRIIESGIKRVFIGMRDPNPLVAGKGVHALQQAGIEVVENIRHDDSLNLNQAFIKTMQNGMPYIIAKMAMTLDSFIADKNGRSQWITNTDSRKLAHQLRAEADAVLIGMGTALKDNPQLNVRDVEGEHPLRVVYDPEGMLPEDLKLVKTAREISTCVICGPHATPAWRDRMTSLGVELIMSGELALRGLEEGLKRLSEKGINTILCEGGGKMQSMLAELEQIDRVDCMIAPMLLGRGIDMMKIPERLMPDALKFVEHEWREIGSDMYFSGILKKYKVDHKGSADV